MNENEVSARLIVLETFAMMSLGLYLANSKNDPDYSRASALLEHIRHAAVQTATPSGPAVQQAAQQYADHLVT